MTTVVSSPLLYSRHLPATANSTTLVLFFHEQKQQRFPWFISFDHHRNIIEQQQ
jgi:hypothetical protein